MNWSLYQSDAYVNIEALTIPLPATFKSILKTMRDLIKSITVQTAAEKGNVNMPRRLKTPPLNRFLKSKLKSRLLKTSNVG
jgi:hypothetical protein